MSIETACSVVLVVVAVTVCAMLLLGGLAKVGVVGRPAGPDQWIEGLEGLLSRLFPKDAGGSAECPRPHVASSSEGEDHGRS